MFGRSSRPVLPLAQDPFGKYGVECLSLRPIQFCLSAAGPRPLWKLRCGLPFPSSDLVLPVRGLAHDPFRKYGVDGLSFGPFCFWHLFRRAQDPFRNDGADCLSSDLFCVLASLSSRLPFVELKIPSETSVCFAFDAFRVWLLIGFGCLLFGPRPFRKL